LGDLTTIDALLDIAAAPLAEGVARAAMFDADGTIWRGDIGDEAFARAHALVLDSTWPALHAFCARYGARVSTFDELVQLALSRGIGDAARAQGISDDVWRADLFEMQAWVYAGRTRAEIAALGHSFDVFPQMRALLDGLRALGVRTAVVSASHGALVEAAHLPVDAVYGMEPALDDQGRTIAARMQRSTYAHGKVTATQEFLASTTLRPLFAFGDSVLATDRALLAYAHVPVAVNAHGAHRDAARAHPRMFLLDPT
jgi:phosphoserine phosphatase